MRVHLGPDHFVRETQVQKELRNEVRVDLVTEWSRAVDWVDNSVYYIGIGLSGDPVRNALVPTFPALGEDSKRLFNQRSGNGDWAH